ncbi:hypothetical protein AB1Y20_017917 [Prymnesium parvum]|uniref:DNA-directed DNA polymerase n=1 Tax=Prymnesium parvum TaxID=97485 RepID=A0AB34JQG3_PRYPA
MSAASSSLPRSQTFCTSSSIPSASVRARVLCLAAPPPSPAAVAELKSRSSTLFHLWLGSGTPFTQFLSRYQLTLVSPLISSRSTARDVTNTDHTAPAETFIPPQDQWGRTEEFNEPHGRPSTAFSTSQSNNQTRPNLPTIPPGQQPGLLPRENRGSSSADAWPIAWSNRLSEAPSADERPASTARAAAVAAPATARPTTAQSKRLNPAGKKRQASRMLLHLHSTFHTALSTTQPTTASAYALLFPFADDAIEQRAWSQGLELRHASAEELSWAEAAPLLAFTFHFADGSSSVRPSAAATPRCDPHAAEHRVVGCTLFAPKGAEENEGAEEKWSHWKLTRQDSAEWRVVRRLLQMGRGAMVVPHSLAVMRAMVIEDTAAGGGDDWVGVESQGDRQGMAGPWLDPVLLGWLCRPDSTEAELQLPRLHLAYVQHEAEPAPARDLVSDELRRCCSLVRSLLRTLRGAHESEASLQRVLWREMRCARIVARMETTGLPISPSMLKEHVEAIRARERALTTQCERLMGGPINLASAQQVSEALYVQLRLPRPGGADAAAKAGHGSTSETHLQQLCLRHPETPLPKHVLEYREITKLRSAFLEPFADKAVRKGDGTTRIYCQWHMMSTGTGRLSARHPNVQQVPKGATYLHTAAGGQPPAEVCVRAAFVASKNCAFLSADYTQLEMRLMAAFSRDPKCLQALHAGGDLFKEMCCRWHGKPIDQVSAEERNQAKQLCYGLCYGLGIERLAGVLNANVAYARSLRSEFLRSFPKLEHFQEVLRQQARQHGAVTTIGGRKRFLPHIRSADALERAKAERQAVNSVIQGSAADIVKEAMIRCTAALRANGIGARLCAQLHDEMLLEVDEASVLSAARLVKHEMENLAHSARMVSCSSWLANGASGKPRSAFSID